MKTFDIETQSKYMRIPFKDSGRNASGCDCGGLVWLIYKNELGIELPDWRDLYTGTTLHHKIELDKAVSTMLGENGVDVTSGKYRPFDVASFRIAGDPIHVGVMINEHVFIHIMNPYRVTTDSIRHMSWEKRIDKVYRHEKML